MRGLHVGAVPRSRNSSDVVGPIEATTHFRSPYHCPAQSHRLCHLEEMDGLCCGRKEDDVDFAVGHRTARCAKRFQILWQRPLIDRDSRYDCPTVSKPGQQIGIGDAGTPELRP